MEQKAFTVQAIGHIENNEKSSFIQLLPKYTEALEGLEGFSHLKVIYWLDKMDQPEMREIFQVASPYKQAPDILGIFATRSPIRPNPLAVSTSGVIHLDKENGRIQLDYIDAENNSPLLDIKPYTPSEDRVETPLVPEWSAHWPKNVETSGDFDWENEFNF
ncbi:TrmO family methyltransferase domain-containing protein [Enterococcus sp. CWB-B31]|uniref:TrmO family methyltransferase domain-containing protein n=1 Tax=Enterococcus sp. CWB-B31 TaxID=2885159 RepID=UPI001E4EC365|nr:TrmO family methyltransferase [Enterococcus sp. CWB-B31]MCB5954508.1 TrmO family methyltransferase [Enterococcus sp. CWB-B31]